MNVLIARFCRGGWERTELGSWLAAAYCRFLRPCPGDTKISSLADFVEDRCPTDAARNHALAWAQQNRADALFMLDHDNAPHPGWLPFAVAYLKANPAAVLAAPYCGAAPERLVQVTVRDLQAPEGRRRISRALAARKRGLEPAYGVGTVLAIGLRCLELIEPPWFSYRYHDRLHTEAGTEDFVYSERVVDAGGLVTVSWDHWSGHYKGEMVGKPEAEAEADQPPEHTEDFDR